MTTTKIIYDHISCHPTTDEEYIQILNPKTYIYIQMMRNSKLSTNTHLISKVQIKQHIKRDLMGTSLINLKDISKSLPLQYILQEALLLLSSLLFSLIFI